MTPLQRAARNLIVATGGFNDVDLIELAFKNRAIVSMTENMVADALNGPFGEVASDHTCQALDGIDDALDIISTEGSDPRRALLDLRAAAVETVSKAPGTDAFESLIKAVFGDNIRVVRVEPATR